MCHKLLRHTRILQSICLVQIRKKSSSVHSFLQSVFRPDDLPHIHPCHRLICTLSQKSRHIIRTVCRITDPFADAVKTDHSYYHICKRRDHRLMNSRHFKGSAPGSVSFHKKKITKAGQLFQDLLFGAGNLWLPGLVMSRDDVSVLFYKPACSRNVLCLCKRTFRFPCHMRGCGHDHTFSLSGKYFCQSKDQTGLSAASCECHSKRFFIFLHDTLHLSSNFFQGHQALYRSQILIPHSFLCSRKHSAGKQHLQYSPCDTPRLV